MKLKKEDVVKSEKLWQRLESEKSKNFSKDFAEIDEKILAHYDRLDRAKKLQDVVTIREAWLEIEKLRNKKFMLKQNQGKEISILEGELRELAAPYVENWIDSLKREVRRLMDARVFDVIQVKRTIDERKIFSVASNLTPTERAIKKILTGISEIRGALGPLAKLDGIYQKVLNEIPDSLETKAIELDEFSYNEIREGLAPVVGRMQDVSFFVSEEMIKNRETSDLASALRRKA